MSIIEETTFKFEEHTGPGDFKQDIKNVANGLIECPQCPKTFKTKSGLRKHKKTKHIEITPEPEPESEPELEPKMTEEIKQKFVDMEYNEEDYKEDYEAYGDEYYKDDEPLEEEEVDLDEYEYVNPKEQKKEVEYEKNMKNGIYNKDDDEQDELLKLRDQFKKLVLNNNININEKCTTNNDFERIDKMNVEELKSRIIMAKHSFSKSIDKKITDNCLSMVNLIVGSALGCLEELQYEVEKNIILSEATNKVISQEILIHIDPKLKMAGLYSIDVATAFKKAKLKKKENETEEKLEIV